MPRQRIQRDAGRLVRYIDGERCAMRVQSLRYFGRRMGTGSLPHHLSRETRHQQLRLEERTRLEYAIHTDDIPVAERQFMQPRPVPQAGKRSLGERNTRDTTHFRANTTIHMPSQIYEGSNNPSQPYFSYPFKTINQNDSPCCSRLRRNCSARNRSSGVSMPMVSISVMPTLIL